MADRDYMTTLSLNARPEEVYRAVATSEGIAGWWTRHVSFDGRQGSEAEMRFPAAAFRARMRVDVLDPPRLVLWSCLDAEHPPGVSDDPRDWIGTRIRFEIEPEPEGGARLRFTHHGLTPLQCADTCSDIWHFYLHQSLKALVETGTGQPATD